jgi:hypothetical protein
MKRPEIHGHIVALRWRERVGIQDASQPFAGVDLEARRLHLGGCGLRIRAKGIRNVHGLLGQDSGGLPTRSIETCLVTSV